MWLGAKSYLSSDEQSTTGWNATVSYKMNPKFSVYSEKTGLSQQIAAEAWVQK